MQSVQREPRTEHGCGLRLGKCAAGRDQNCLLAMRYRNHGSFQTHTGTAGVLPRMLSAAAQCRLSQCDSVVEDPPATTAGQNCSGEPPVLRSLEITGAPGFHLTKRHSYCYGFLVASQGAARKPFFLRRERTRRLGRLGDPGRGDFSKSRDEHFRFLLRADGDTQEVVHRRETAANENIASGKL